MNHLSISLASLLISAIHNRVLIILISSPRKYYDITRYWNALITLFNFGRLVKVISCESEVFGIFIVGLFTGALNFSFLVLYVVFVWKLVLGSGVDVTNFPCTKIK